MFIEVIHKISYEYSDEVFLEPQIIQLKPISNHIQNLLKFELHIFPKPTGISENFTIENSSNYLIWFENKTKTLELTSKFQIKTFNVNPFNFLIYPNNVNKNSNLYNSSELKALNNYLSYAIHSENLKSFLTTMFQNSKDFPNFLIGFAKWIQTELYYEKREEGFANSPDHTWEIQSGTCRDFAMLYMHGCRFLKIASRFVTGYVFEENLKKPELHAWVEVFLPGAGWRGYDPSYGLMANEKYIILSSSSEAGLTYPVIGYFRGNAIQKMKSDINIQILD